MRYSRQGDAFWSDESWWCNTADPTHLRNADGSRVAEVAFSPDDEDGICNEPQYRYSCGPEPVDICRLPKGHDCQHIAFSAELVARSDRIYVVSLRSLVLA